MRAQIVDAAFVRSHIGKYLIVDVRSADVYEAGHIPTAINIPFNPSSNEDSTLEVQELSRAFRRHALDPEYQIIIYCQNGRRAMTVCDLLEQAGYDHLFLYSDSFSDWSSNPDNPIEK